MNLIGLILTIIVGLFIFVGSLFTTIFKNNKKFTDFSISLAFGVITSLILFEVMPHTYEILNGELNKVKTIICIVILVLIGIFILKILDCFIPHHEHEEHHEHKHKDDECHNEHLKHIGVVSAIALIMHNIIEGMSLYLISTTSILSGLLMCIGIGLHNVPMGLIISSTLYNTNYTKKEILNISLIVSLSTFVGGVIMFLLGGVPQLVKGILLGITLGMLIYISMFELLHQIYHMKNHKIVSIGIFLGILILLLSLIFGNILGHTH